MTELSDSLWACGLVDEVEVCDPEHDLCVYGPFNSKEDAAAYARTLSIDPDEADVFRLRQPVRGVAAEAGR